MNGNGELAGFLQKLSEDRELQEAYTRDPEGTLRQAGLSEETIRAVLSRDLEQVKGVLEKEAGIGYMLFMTIIEPPA
jgi:Aromatic-ring-opening dioxygenase LigAB, LigA subunit